MSKKNNEVIKILATLRIATQFLPRPAAQQVIVTFGRDPFLILISCILSLRTKDTVSLPASVRLFALAKTPKPMLFLTITQIQKTIYPVGFYRRKALAIKRICQILIEKYQSQVPDNAQDLMALPGVGIKTANLVLAEGFQIPALCVDTHVHRIANRLGWVKTTTPEQTERELQHIIPRDQWTEVNRLFVMWGQNICTPLSPRCSVCPIAPLCACVGVTKSR
jgi:endonuclease III